MTLIGINPTPLARWFPDHPYLDRAKLPLTWGLNKGLGAKEEGGRLQGPFPLPPEAVDLIVTWDGGSEMGMQLDGMGWVKSITPIDAHTFKASVPAGELGRTGSLISRGTTLANPPKVSVVDARYYDRWKKGELFDPERVAELSDFPVQRFMDWQNTNGGGWPAMPLEDILKFANLCGARPWVNVPAFATDEQIVAFVELAEKLADQRPIIEYSNENPWNTGFAASKAVVAQATKAGISADAQFAKLIANMGRIARGKKVDLVFGGQPANPARGRAVAKGLIDAGGKAADFRYFSMTTYVAGTLNQATGPLLALMKAGDVQGALDNVLGKTGEKSEGQSLAATEKANAENVKTARDGGWEPVAYEAGPHINVNGFPKAQQAEAVAAVTKLQQDPRFAVPIAQGIFDQWRRLGIAIGCWYNASSLPTENGYFGAKGTPTWDVLKAAIAAEKPSEVDLLKAQVANLTAERDALKARLADIGKLATAA